MVHAGNHAFRLLRTYADTRPGEYLALVNSFGVVEIAVRLVDPIDPTKAAFYTNPAVYAVIAGGAAGFLLLTSALSRGSVTTARSR